MSANLSHQPTHTHTHTHTQLFCGSVDFVRDYPGECVCVCVTRVSRFKKGKANLDFTEARIVNGSGINWSTGKSAPHCRQITTPAPHHSVFYRPNALLATQPSASNILLVLDFCSFTALTLLIQHLDEHWHCKSYFCSSDLSFLVLAHPDSPGQNRESRKMADVVVVSSVLYMNQSWSVCQGI